MTDVPRRAAPSAVTTDAEAIAAVARMFDLLGDAGRLTLVLNCVDAPQPVSYLAAAAGMSQSLASHHLRQLRDLRLLKTERRGRQVLYSLDDDHVRCIIEDMFAHVGHR